MVLLYSTRPPAWLAPQIDNHPGDSSQIHQTELGRPQLDQNLKILNKPKTKTGNSPYFGGLDGSFDLHIHVVVFEIDWGYFGQPHVPFPSQLRFCLVHRPLHIDFCPIGSL